MIELAKLPTHLARVVSRLNVIGFDASGDTFLLASYIAESLIKTIAIVLCSGIRQVSANTAYRLEYDLVRGDGLGTWESVVGTAASHSYAGYVPQDIQPLSRGLIKTYTNRRFMGTEALKDCSTILELLGNEAQISLLGQMLSTC